LGVPADVASWGSMLNDGTRYLTVAPHMSTFPGFAIMLSVLGFNLIGDGLRDMLDVKR
jgi:peptide/nickel transport system permease protein